MIKEFERKLEASEIKAIKKEIERSRKSMPKAILSLLIHLLVLAGFTIILIYYPKIYLFIPFGLISLFLLWSLTYLIPDLIRLPSFLRNKEKILENGMAKVTELKIERYIKINQFEDEGNYYICEYKNELFLIGGQEYFGNIRKLYKQIQEIRVLDTEKTGIYYEKKKKFGEPLEPFFEVNQSKNLSLFDSDLFQKLLSKKVVPGKLEDFEEFLGKKGY